jgi:hypothetical protein
MRTYIPARPQPYPSPAPVQRVARPARATEPEDTRLALAQRAASPGGYSLSSVSIMPPGHSGDVSGPQIQPVQRQSADNQTGMPDGLKANIEELSGGSLDDVRVHYNSLWPAELDALAYTQGTEIHVAPGQEQHLAHEAWHVVQQKQGRVQPTLSLKGLPVNDQSALEQEASEYGARAVQVGDPKTSPDEIRESSADDTFQGGRPVQRLAKLPLKKDKDVNRSQIADAVVALIGKGQAHQALLAVGQVFETNKGTEDFLLNLARENGGGKVSDTQAREGFTAVSMLHASGGGLVCSRPVNNPHVDFFISDIRTNKFLPVDLKILFPGMERDLGSMTVRLRTKIGGGVIIVIDIGLMSAALLQQVWPAIAEVLGIDAAAPVPASRAWLVIDSTNRHGGFLAYNWVDRLGEMVNARGQAAPPAAAAGGRRGSPPAPARAAGRQAAGIVPAAADEQEPQLVAPSPEAVGARKQVLQLMPVFPAHFPGLASQSPMATAARPPVWQPPSIRIGTQSRRVVQRITVPLPTAHEGQILKDMTSYLSILRRRLTTGSVRRQRSYVQQAEHTLNAIQEVILQAQNPAQPAQTIQNYISTNALHLAAGPLTAARNILIHSVFTDAGTTFAQVPKLDSHLQPLLNAAWTIHGAVSGGRNIADDAGGRELGKNYTDGARPACMAVNTGNPPTLQAIAANIGRPPDFRDIISGGASRLTWRFVDRSELAVDIPGGGNENFQISFLPHMHRVAGDGTYLSPNGIGVPQASEPAHVELHDAKFNLRQTIENLWNAGVQGQPRRYELPDHLNQ